MSLPEEHIELNSAELIEFLLREGADTDQQGAPILESATNRRGSPKILKLIKDYSR